MKFRKTVAIALALLLCLSLSVPALATSKTSNQSGTGTFEGTLPGGSFSVSLPTEAFNYIVDPFSMINKTSAERYDGIVFADTASGSTGHTMYFKNTYKEAQVPYATATADEASKATASVKTNNISWSVTTTGVDAAVWKDIKADFVAALTDISEPKISLTNVGTSPAIGVTSLSTSAADDVQAFTAAATATDADGSGANITKTDGGIIKVTFSTGNINHDADDGTTPAQAVEVASIEFVVEPAEDGTDIADGNIALTFTEKVNYYDNESHDFLGYNMGTTAVDISANVTVSYDATKYALNSSSTFDADDKSNSIYLGAQTTSTTVTGGVPAAGSYANATTLGINATTFSSTLAAAGSSSNYTWDGKAYVVSEDDTGTAATYNAFGFKLVGASNPNGLWTDANGKTITGATPSVKVVWNAKSVATDYLGSIEYGGSTYYVTEEDAEAGVDISFDLGGGELEADTAVAYVGSVAMDSWYGTCDENGLSLSTECLAHLTETDGNSITFTIYIGQTDADSGEFDWTDGTYSTNTITLTGWVK